MVIKYNCSYTLPNQEVKTMEKTRLNLKTPNGGFCIDVLAGSEFEEDILSVLDKYADKIHASDFY